MLYHLQFSLQATSPETFGYTLVYHRPLPNVDATANGSVMRCKWLSLYSVKYVWL